MEKVLEFSVPVSDISQLMGVLKTSLGKRINPELMNLLYTSISNIGKDGIILVEENISEKNEIEMVQGIELDKGYASSYFVNDLKNFEVVYENPYLLITKNPINSLNQIREIIEYIQLNNRPLVIIAEEISKDIISTLVLNNIQKKFKIAVIKYTSIQFIKTGILEDLSVLTHSNYFQSNLKNKNATLTIDDLGQAQKVIIKKDKSTFIVSKFAKIIAKRRINELNRQLLLSETDYEKSLFKTRIARLSGNITKIKIGVSNVDSRPNRLKSHQKEGWSVYKTKNYKTGFNAEKVETGILRWLRKDLLLGHHLTSDFMPQGGHSETVDASEIDLPTIWAKVEELSVKQKLS
jgi:chaperonin GroEL